MSISAEIREATIRYKGWKCAALDDEKTADERKNARANRDHYHAELTRLTDELHRRCRLTNPEEPPRCDENA